MIGIRCIRSVFFSALLLVLFFTKKYSATTSLNFLVVGDWGKGGIYGDITSGGGGYELSVGPDPDDDTRNTIGYRQLENKDNNNNNNKNSNSQKVTYTYQVAVAKAMASWAKYYQASFVVGLGDNFYNDGVSSTTDSMWITHWKYVYTQKYNSLQVPWYTVLG